MSNVSNIPFDVRDDIKEGRNSNESEGNDDD
jgi:hypothetical protein